MGISKEYVEESVTLMDFYFQTKQSEEQVAKPFVLPSEVQEI